MVEGTIDQALSPCLRDRQYPMVTLPALDGMGVSGDGGRWFDGYAIIASLPEPAVLLAAMSAVP